MIIVAFVFSLQIYGPVVQNGRIQNGNVNAVRENTSLLLPSPVASLPSSQVNSRASSPLPHALLVLYKSCLLVSLNFTQPTIVAVSLKMQNFEMAGFSQPQGFLRFLISLDCFDIFSFN